MNIFFKSFILAVAFTNFLNAGELNISNELVPVDSHTQVMSPADEGSYVVLAFPKIANQEYGLCLPKNIGERLKLPFWPLGGLGDEDCDTSCGQSLTMSAVFLEAEDDRLWISIEVSEQPESYAFGKPVEELRDISDTDTPVLAPDTFIINYKERERDEYKEISFQVVHDPFGETSEEGESVIESVSRLFLIPGLGVVSLNVSSDMDDQGLQTMDAAEFLDSFRIIQLGQSE